MRHFKPLLIAALLISAAVPSQAADPLEGLWLTEGGADARFSPCDKGLCIEVVSGEFTGQNIGHMVPKGGNKYEGEIRDPADDNTYTGNAQLNGDTLKMQGCVLIFCQTQHWSRR